MPHGRACGADCKVRLFELRANFTPVCSLAAGLGLSVDLRSVERLACRLARWAEAELGLGHASFELLPILILIRWNLVLIHVRLIR